MVLVADEPITITHPEHKPLKLEKNVYAIRIQQRYEEGKWRDIRD